MYFDMNDMVFGDDGSMSMTGWFSAVHDEAYSKYESCYLSVSIDPSTGMPFSDGVQVLEHEWNQECSFVG